MTTSAFASDCLAKRHVLITGASSGIGRSAAEHLAVHGARLSLVGRNLERLDATRAALSGDGHSIHQVDLESVDTAADAIADIAKRHGAFDGIFYSAGATLVLPLRLLKDKHLDEAFGAGVYGAFGTLKAAARKGIMNDGGSIVVMSSVAALRGRPALSAYCAAKAAVLGLTRVLALELAPRRVRVNAVVASTITTEMHWKTLENADMIHVDANEARHPLGFGAPAQMDDAVTFLLSDASTWITGAEIPVDGGYSAG